MRVGIVLDWFHRTDYTSVQVILKQCLNQIEFRTEHQKEDCLDILLVNNHRTPIQTSHYLDTILGKLYSVTRDILLEHGFYLLPINILFEGFNSDIARWDVLFTGENSLFIKENVLHYKKHIPFQISHAESPEYEDEEDSEVDGLHVDRNKYEVTALGGTFDHIHDGHKILLTMAAFVTSKRLIVGVTDEELLVNKKFKEYLQNFDERCSNVQSFIDLIKPTLKTEIVPIKDVCGPTGTVPEIECLVVSLSLIHI